MSVLPDYLEYSRIIFHTFSCHFLCYPAFPSSLPRFAPLHCPALPSELPRFLFYDTPLSPHLVAFTECRIPVNPPEDF